MLIEDLNDEIRNAMRDEETSQIQFEKAKAAAEKLKEELIAKKVSLEEQIASLQEEKAEEEALKATNEALLADEVSYRKSITPDCDWIICAFEKRAAARTAELSGLRGAKAYLAGASEAPLVQTRPTAEGLSDIRFSSLRR